MAIAASRQHDDRPADRPGRDESFEDFVQRHYGPHAGQRGFCADPAQFRAAIAGIGGGKTEIGAFDAIRHVLRFPGIRGLIVAPTDRMLNHSTLLVLKKVAKWWPGLEIEHVKSEHRLVFPQVRGADGEVSQIFLGHGQEADSLRALEAGFFWMDEAPLCKEEVFLVCQGRIRQPGVPHRGWITGTPKGRNWVYRTFVQDRERWPEGRRGRYGFHTWRTHDNPLYQREPEFLTALEESYGQGSDFFRQELEALFVTLTGLVYKQFDAARHCVEMSSHTFTRTVAGVDWGVSSPGCIVVVGEAADGRAWVVEEVYERGKIIAGEPGNDWLSIAQELQRRYDCVFFADPEDRNAILTFQRAGLPIKAAENKRLPGVRVVQGRLASDKLRVRAGAAPHLVGEFGQYHWRSDGDGNPIEDQDPAKEFDHALDALRYALMGLANRHSAFEALLDSVADEDELDGTDDSEEFGA